MGLRKASRKPEWQLKIAKERIGKLLEMAEKNFMEKPGYSRRYCELAIKTGMRYNIRLDKKVKRKICKKCFSFLVPGETSTIRTSPKQQAIITACKNCNSIIRFPYRREKVTGKAK